MRELPETYPWRFQVERGVWETEQREFSAETIALWAEVGELYSHVWEQARRWIVLWDKFIVTADDRCSAECRQLESLMQARLADMDLVVPDEGEESEGGEDVPDEVAAMRARAAAGGV